MAIARGTRTVKIRRSEVPVTYLSPSELISRIAKKTKIRAVDVKDLVRGLSDVVCEALYAGESVNLPGIGRIEYDVRSNQRFNPYKKEFIPTRQYPSLKFMPEKRMRDTIRRSFDAERERRLSELAVSPSTEQQDVPTEDRGSEV